MPKKKPKIETNERQENKGDKFMAISNSILFHCKPDPQTPSKSLLECEACLERQVLESLQMSHDINPEH